MERKRPFITVLTVLLFSSFCFAETVVLKSGKTREGKIIERTDEYIKMEIEGVPLTYYLDEIEYIDGESVSQKITENIPVESVDDTEKLIKKALELSGFRKQIEQVADIVSAQATQRQMELKPEIYEALSRIIKDSYRANVLYGIVVDYLRSNFDQNRISVFLEWLSSPLSKTITELEVQASTVTAMQEMKDYATQLQFNPPAQERLALVKRFDEVSGATEKTIEIILASFRGLAMAIDATLPAEERLKEGQLEQMCSQMKTQLELPMKNNTLAGFLYTYRSLSNEELKQYIDFYETDASQWFNRISFDGFKIAMTKAAEETGNQMATWIKQASK